MYLNREKGFLCALLTLGLVPRLRDASVVKLRFLCAVTICALTVFANAADKPAETKYQTLLEKFAAAYSAMDAKALEPLVSKQILDQCKEQFHQYRKTHQQPELTITGEKPEKDASILASVTLKVNGKDVYANQQTTYILKDNRIAQIQQQRQEAVPQAKVVPSKQQTNSFWDAVRLADAIGIITVENKAIEAGSPNGGLASVTTGSPQEKPQSRQSAPLQEKSETAAVICSVKTLLGGEPITGEAVKLPKWTFFQLKPGRHLLPLTKSGNNFEAFGMAYEIPVLSADNDKLFADTLTQYKQLAPEKENEFLKNLLLDAKFKSLHYAALRKIAMSGEFNKKLDVAGLEFWHKVCQAQGVDLMIKNALFNQLGSKNFDPNAPLFLTALEDKQLSSMVGGLYMRHDKAAFTAKMLQYLDDPAKREIAVINSFALAGNPEYVAKAMKYFDPNDKKQFMLFIPVLAAKDNQAGKEAVAKFLKESDPKKDFNTRVILFTMLWRNNDPAYIAETKAFLAAEAKNEMLLKSPEYMTALGYLYKNNDVDGMKMLLKYLDSVKPGSPEEMMLRGLIFSLRIKPLATPPNGVPQLAGSAATVATVPATATVVSGKSGDAVSRNQPLSGNSAAGLVGALRRDLEAKIKVAENIQQNPKDNIKNN